MLGPLSAGIVYVRKAHFARLRPILLGAANVRSPDFIAQEEIVFPDTAARYEPGVLNLGPDPGHEGFARFAPRRGDGCGQPPGSPRMVRRLASMGWANSGFEPAGLVEGPNASGILTGLPPDSRRDR